MTDEVLPSLAPVTLRVEVARVEVCDSVFANVELRTASPWDPEVTVRLVARRADLARWPVGRRVLLTVAPDDAA